MAIPIGIEFVIGIICTSLTIYFPTKSLAEDVTVTKCIAGPIRLCTFPHFYNQLVLKPASFQRIRYFTSDIAPVCRSACFFFLRLSTDEATLSEDRNKCV